MEEQALRFAEALPENLEDIVMENCTNTIYAVMAVLFDNKRAGILQKLGAVKLVLQWGMREGSVEAEHRIEDGKTLGIMVKILPDTVP
jgi:hypothetical protein